MSAPERLFGCPGDEALHDDPVTVYELRIDPWLEEEPSPDTKPQIIEEWTTDNPRKAFPSGMSIVEHVCEWIADDYPGDEGFDDDLMRAALKAQAAEWFDAVMAAWCKRTTYRMAADRVAEHVVTWGADGEPLYDGEPMYRRR